MVPISDLGRVWAGLLPGHHAGCSHNRSGHYSLIQNTVVCGSQIRGQEIIVFYQQRLPPVILSYQRSIVALAPGVEIIRTESGPQMVTSPVLGKSGNRMNGGVYFYPCASASGKSDLLFAPSSRQNLQDKECVNERGAVSSIVPANSCIIPAVYQFRSFPAKNSEKGILPRICLNRQ